MSLLWRTAMNEYHTQHQPSHWNTKAGFGESPCGYYSCPQFNEEHFDAMDRAEGDRTTKGKFQVIDASKSNLHAMESHIDEDTVAAYRKATPPKKHLPFIFTHKGKTHILDGHHRLIADTLEGRKSPVIHVNLDEEH
jgi:hypothetical protein